MIRSTLSQRALPLSRPALALGMVLAATAGSLALAPVAQAQRQQQQPAAGPNLELSRDFRAASNAALAAWLAAKARPDVVAAQQSMMTAATAFDSARGEAQQPAKQAFDAAKAALRALVQGEIAQFEGSLAKIANNDDRFRAGQIGYDMGQFIMDDPIRRRALVLQLDSGHVAADQQLIMRYLVGRIDFFAGDMANARTFLGAAFQGGYYANDLDRLLAETYFNENDAAGGLAILRQGDERARSGGRPPVISSIMRGLNVSKDALKIDEAGYFGSRLIEVRPGADSWRQATAAIRRAGGFDNSVLIDLLRASQRSNNFDGTVDYMEFIEVTRNLGYPRELLAVLQQGLAAGVLIETSPAVREARADANAREALDRSTNLLADYERDARAPGANVATIVGAADSYLSYGQPAKAEEFYVMALTKPGVDSAAAKLRLGIAQFDQGKFAEAATSFGEVTGPRAAIAALWATLARQRVAPSAS